MLRVAALALSLIVPISLHSPAFAEQNDWSGLPAPTTKKEWVRAVQFRVEANMPNRYSTKAVAGAQRAVGRVELKMAFAADGQLLDARMLESSGDDGLDQSLIRAVKALPPMPAFTPDMAHEKVEVVLPINKE